jgi:hypothetical protein
MLEPFSPQLDKVLGISFRQSHQCATPFSSKVHSIARQAQLTLYNHQTPVEAKNIYLNLNSAIVVWNAKVDHDVRLPLLLRTQSFSLVQGLGVANSYIPFFCVLPE